MPPYKRKIVKVIVTCSVCNEKFEHYVRVNFDKKSICDSCKHKRQLAHETRYRALRKEKAMQERLERQKVAFNE
jgi:hypothetical protein